MLSLTNQVFETSRVILNTMNTIVSEAWLLNQKIGVLFKILLDCLIRCTIHTMEAFLSCMDEIALDGLDGK